MQQLIRFGIPAILSAFLLTQIASAQEPASKTEKGMDLGDFSISLAVSDIRASKSFYEKLGFVQTGGDIEQNWIIMVNGEATIGLFQGMFEENILTFNPEDVRGIQRSLKEQGTEIITEADESTEGPAHMVLQDPDGNLILLDQF